MLAKRIQVIRKHQVRKGSSIVLPSGRHSQGAVTPAGAVPCAAGAAAQARIVESNSDYVILEMVCGCGCKSFVQCNYGNVAGSQNDQERRP